MVRVSLGMAALCFAALGCNLVLGLDEPLRASDGVGGAVSGGAGGSGASGAEGGTGGSGGEPPMPCTPECSEERGCFEGICGGHEPVDMAPGENIGCVLTRSGAVFCAGNNGFGGLGRAPASAPDNCFTSIGGLDRPCSHEMLRVTLPGPAYQIATGGHTACAALRDGRLFCWGSNENGMVGHLPDPGGIDETCLGAACHPTPVEVTGIGKVQGVAMTSWYHVCAINASNEAWCWGRNDWGQLGIGTFEANTVFAPQKVVTTLSLISATLSDGASCFTDTQRTVHCVGENVFGQFGDPKESTECVAMARCEPLLRPRGITLTGTLSMALTRSSSCFLDGPMGAKCAGWNGIGNLGSAWNVEPHDVLEGQAELDDESLTAIGAGDLHTCALATDGAVFCWGSNNVGQLGIGTAESVDTTQTTQCAYGLPCHHAPIAIADLVATRLRVGTSSSMAIRADTNTVVGWGMNQGASLGHAPGKAVDDIVCYYSTNQQLYCSPRPVPVGGLPGPDSR